MVLVRGLIRDLKNTSFLFANTSCAIIPREKTCTHACNHMPCLINDPINLLQEPIPCIYYIRKEFDDNIKV
jgi:hypothetical protein